MISKVFCVLFLARITTAIPQVNLDDRIQTIFGTLGNRGFGDIVEPENIPATQSPQFLHQNGEACRCIPYHQCEPDNTRGTTDSRFFGEIDIRFNEETCRDVLDVCCRKGKISGVPITPPANTAPPPPSQTGCGTRNVNGIDFALSGNTNEAGFGEFPWMVAILSQNIACLCGGSLIHPQVVLTGAHCVFNYTENQLRIRAGEWDTQTTKERLPHQERNVQTIIYHNDFNTKTLANDIALLILTEPVQLDSHINVVCLPPQGFSPNSQSCFASGWGKNVFGKEGKYSAIMKKVSLPMVPFHSCQEKLKATRLGKRFELHNSFICAGGNTADTCQGDGGSPLVCPISSGSEKYMQVGSVAWGIGCHDAIPGVYANIPLFRDWIDQNVRRSGFDPQVYSY